MRTTFSLALGVVMTIASAEPVESPPHVVSASVRSPSSTQSPPLVRIVATDFEFSLPPSASAGVTAIRLVNAGRSPHYALFYRLPAGRSARDFMDWRASRRTAPAWLTMLTGPGPVMPGDSTDVTLTLDAGHYLVICGYPGSDGRQHVDMGMLHEIDAVGNAPAAAAASYSPPPASVITLTDSGFTLGSPVGSGRQTLMVVNAGTTAGQALLVRLPERVTTDDEKRWFDDQFRSRRRAIPSGGVLRLSAGERVTVTRDFSPGRWAVLSHAGGWKALEFHVDPVARARDDRPAAASVVRPYLVALSVADARAMHRWYRDVLGFRSQRDPYVPVPGVVVGFLELDGFHIELVQRDGARRRAQAQPDSTNEVSLHGFVKLGFVVPDVDSTLATLAAKGVRPFFGPASDTAFRVRHALIRDPEGNVLQLFQPLP